MPAEADNLDKATLEKAREATLREMPDEVSEEAPGLPGARITYKRASSVVSAPTEWLWKFWIQAKAVNLLTGRQGSGKTTFVSWLVAALTNGDALPGDLSRPPVRVAFLSLEEGEGRVVGRLRAAGANLDAVDVLGDVEDMNDDGARFLRRWQLPRDISILGDHVQRRSIGLVVVDGLGYSIAGDSHNYAVVGSALSTLAGEAERTGAAILGLVHPPKGSSDPTTAAIGSTAWTAIPRVSIVLNVDPTDPSKERRAVRVGKTNSQMPDTGYSFVIANDPDEESGVLRQLAASTVSAEALAAGAVSEEDRSDLDEASEFLLDFLAAGPRGSKETFAEARKAGISDRTLKRAKATVGARSRKLGVSQGWAWELLPEGGQGDRSPSSSSVVGPLGILGPEQDVCVSNETSSSQGSQPR